MSSAKFFALDHESQVEYFNKVLSPLLREYYIATSKNKEIAVEKFKRDSASFNSFFDIIIFIEQNIIHEANEHLRDLEEEDFGTFYR